MCAACSINLGPLFSVHSTFSPLWVSTEGVVYMVHLHCALIHALFRLSFFACMCVQCIVWKGWLLEARAFVSRLRRTVCKLQFIHIFKQNVAQKCSCIEFDRKWKLHFLVTLFVEVNFVHTGVAWHWEASNGQDGSSWLSVPTLLVTPLQELLLTQKKGWGGDSFLLVFLVTVT